MNLDVNGTPLTVTERGTGAPVLLLHGGGGPLTVEPWADRFANRSGARVLTPIHPGFAGTDRPADLTSIQQLAALYVDLLDALDLEGVVVIGNSIGGWIAAEMAVLSSPRVAGYVLLNSTGIGAPGFPLADFFSLTPAEIAQLSYADPERFGVDPSKLAPGALQAMAANRATLQIYGGQSMSDSTLAERLGSVTTPTLVVWGEADRIALPGLGRAFATAIPGAEFELVPRAGHLPQIEQPDALVEVVERFCRRVRQ